MTKKIMIFSLFIVGCSSITYQDDKGYLNSAQANSNEFPVSINGKICKDLDGNVGACLKSIASDKPIVITLPARPYSYRLQLTCSMPLGITFPVDVQKDMEWKFEIKPELFSDFRLWTCMGEVTPYDRDQMVSALWHLRVLVVSSDYQPREKIDLGSRAGTPYAVLGAYAKYSDWCDNEGCHADKKKTVVKYEGTIRAFSESEVLRFNYLGY